MEKSSILFIWVVLLQVSMGMGAVYKVGDNAGWTIMGNPDYQSWAASKTFKRGDTIVFEYNPQFHNVMQVTHLEYRSCNVSAPRVTYTSGNDSITIKKTKGHFYFVCGVPGHCEAGQKVNIRVFPAAHDSIMSPAPLSSSMAPAPSPSTNDAVASMGGSLAVVIVSGISLALVLFY